MDHTINQPSTDTEQATQLLEKIDGLAHDLAAVFAPSRETVSAYTDHATLSLSHQDTMITDTTLTKINTLDKHLTELYAIVTEEELLTHHHAIWTTIQESIDTITQSLLQNNHFHMTYGYKISEITAKLNQAKYTRIAHAPTA